MSQITRLLAGCALALSAGAACLAQPGISAPGGGNVRVDASGSGKDVVRLVDAATLASIAADRLAGETVKGSLVTPDGTVVAVRHGRGDEGDSLTAYAIAWRVDPATGRRTATATQALAYRVRDGRLDVTLRPVPNGTVVQVRSGRHVPFWHKTFFHERASGTWYEWPRELAPGDPSDSPPTAVGRTDSGAAYAAWVRPLEPPRD